MTHEELEGRIRAIEAVLAELPQLTPAIVDAAKAYLRDPKRSSDQAMASMRLQINGHLDQHAERALDELKQRKKSSPAAGVGRPASAGPKVKRTTSATRPMD